MEAQAIVGLPQGMTELPRDEPRTAEFARTYRSHGGPLYRTALRMLRRPEEAEDAVQDAFLTLHRKSPDVPESEVGRWLHRVLVNGCLDRLRRGKRWKEEEVTDHVRPSAPASDGLRIDLEQAVSQLPERARLVFLLHDVEGLDHAETAQLLDVTTGTTKSQLFRARQILRENMERGTA